MIFGLNPGRVTDFSFLLIIHRLPPIQWVPWFFSAVKRHDAGHSPPSSAKVKNEWNYTSTFSLCCHDLGRDNYIFPPAEFCDLVQSYHTSSYMFFSLQ
jgi:hypothetical protein